DVQLTAPVHPPRALYRCDRARHVASWRNHNAAIGKDWKNGFEINSFPFSRRFGADAIDHAQRHFGAGGNQKVVGGAGGLLDVSNLRIRSSTGGRILLLSAERENGRDQNTPQM